MFIACSGSLNGASLLSLCARALLARDYSYPSLLRTVGRRSHATAAPSPFPFADFEVFAHGTFCCDQAPCKDGHSSFLYEGPGVSPAQCADKCLHDYNPDVCKYIVVATVGSGTPYCMNAEYCNATNKFGGTNVTIFHRTLPARPPVPPPPPSKPPPAAFSVIDPSSKAALIRRVAQPVYSGAAGAGQHGAGIATEDHLAWAQDHFPWFEADDEDLEEAFYFRMYSYHNHINQTADSAGGTGGHLPERFSYVTEFYPHVPWAAKYNTIPCAAGHHIHEGRWLRDSQIMSDYLKFWFWGGGSPEYYTFWVATSAWANYQIAGNASLLHELYPALASNYWDAMYKPNFSEEYQCYWHLSDREGEENSVGGDGCRPVSNSVMYGEASALQNIATLLGNSTAAAEWGRQAAFWQDVILKKLWNEVGLSVSRALSHSLTLCVSAVRRSWSSSSRSLSRSPTTHKGRRKQTTSNGARRMGVCAAQFLTG